MLYSAVRPMKYLECDINPRSGVGVLYSTVRPMKYLECGINLRSGVGVLYLSNEILRK